MTRRTLIPTITLGLALAACSQPGQNEPLGASAVAELFMSYSADYDHIETGEELAELSDLTVLASLKSIRPGPSEVDPEIAGTKIPYVLLDFTVIEPLAEASPSEGTTIHVLLPETAELFDSPVGAGEELVVDVTSVLYLFEYQAHPAMPIEGWDSSAPLYMPVSPQGLILEETGNQALFALEQGAVASASLESFYPSAEPLPIVEPDTP